MEEPLNQARTGVSIVRQCDLTCCCDIHRIYLYDMLTSMLVVVLKLMEEPCWRRADGAVLEES